MQAKTVYSLTAGISIFDEREELGWINYVRGKGGHRGFFGYRRLS